MQKCLVGMYTFIQKTKVRKQNQALVEMGIINTKKAKFFREWRGAFNKKESCRQLAEKFQVMRVRKSFQRIYERQCVEFNAQTYMIERRIELTLATAINRLRYNAQKSKQLRASYELFKEVNVPRNIQHRAFAHWNEINQRRLKIYKTYAFTAIQIKNQILKNIFAPWKHRTQSRR
jgi:hypothetical protein